MIRVVRRPDRKRGRPKGSKNINEKERRLIRSMFRSGLRFWEIVAATGRGESTIEHAVRGLRRKKPHGLPGRHAKRDERIVTLVGQGKTHAEIAKLFGITVRRVGQVLEFHPWLMSLIHEQGVKPAKVAERYRLKPTTVQRMARRRPRARI